MFYLKVNTYEPRPPLWLWTGDGKLYLSRNVLAAEAFEPQYVERMRQIAEHMFPGSKCEPVECSSRQLIPETMRKVLNIA